MYVYHLKGKIKAALEARLYEKPIANYRRALDELIVRDAVARRDGANCFTYRGLNYVMSGQVANVRVFPRLTPDNRPAMDEFLAEWVPVFEDEKPKVGAYIAHVLNSSSDPNEYLQRFPDSLRGYLRKLYEAFDIPVENLTYLEAAPEDPVWKEPYRLLAMRLTTNLLLE